MGEQGAGLNVTVVRGRLSRPPEVRTLVSGDELVGYEVTVPGDDGRPSESVPVVWPGAPAAGRVFEEGDEVVVVGRVRRRFFRAAGATASRTEVVADRVLPAGRAPARRAVLEAVGRVELAVGSDR
jgi:single-strand DNA-binding protein